jgi:hypothetical protein
MGARYTLQNDGSGGRGVFTRYKMVVAVGWVPATQYKMVAAVGFLCVVGGLLRVESCKLEDLYLSPSTDLVSSGGDGGCRQERRKACVRTWLCPGGTGLSLCTVETVAMSNIQREFTFSFGSKLP